MTTIDLIILIAYLIGTVWIGVHCSRKAASSMNSYFLGNNESKWWMLAASGSAANYDVSGTMFLVSLFYVVGLKSFWMLWSWQFFSTAFLMAYMGIWIRKTRVMTAVELMRVRFGNDGGGRMARTAGAILMVVFLVVSVGYTFVGLVKFIPVLLPEQLINAEDPLASGRFWSVVIVVLTTVYVVAGGFSGVVLTSFIQTILMSISGLLVGVIVWFKLDPEAVATVHQAFDVNMMPRATLDMPAGYESWNNFGLLCLYWGVAGILINTSGAGGHYQEQRFLATKNAAEAAKAGFGWGFFIIPRWAMIAGFAFIAVAGLVGTDDPEQILPIVLVDMIPSGLRGLVLAGLFAAFMSTYSSIINAAASIVVRDLIQPNRPGLSDKQLVRLSYAVTVAVVVIGTAIGFRAESIKGIWVWMIAGLIGGTLIPNVLRWHWWRLNGWGYSIGVFGGLLTALVAGLLAHFKVFAAEPLEYQYAPIIWIVTIIGCFAGSLLTRPTRMETLTDFYAKVRPFGLWGPVKTAAGELPPLAGPAASVGRIVLNVILGLTCLMSANLAVFFLIGHFGMLSLLTLGLTLGTGILLYFTWYKPAGEIEGEQ